MYAKDASVKIKTTKMNKAMNGYFIGTVPPYGYNVNRSKKGQTLYIDEEVCDVVEWIFEMALQGLSQKQIAENLNERNYSPAMVYYRTGRKYRTEGDKYWTLSSLSNILTNEKYYGAMIQGKRSQNLAKGQKQVFTTEEEWIEVENTHPAYISREIFDQIQKIRLQSKGKSVFISGKKQEFEKDPVNRYKAYL